jgi:hypothetical protein
MTPGRSASAPSGLLEAMRGVRPWLRRPAAAPHPQPSFLVHVPLSFGTGPRLAGGDHQGEVRLDREDLVFADAVDREAVRLRSEGDDFDGPHHRHCSFVSRGYYADQLLLLRSEDLYDAPERVLAQSFRFVGLESASPRVKRLEAGSYAEVERTTHETLRAHLVPDDRRLGWNMTWTR